MIAPELVNELQQLNREEKLAVIRLLQDDLSDDIDKYFEGMRVFRFIPPIRASDEAVAMLEQLEDESKNNA